MELTLDRDSLQAGAKTAELLARAAGGIELLKNLCVSIDEDRTVRIRGSNLQAYVEVVVGTHDGDSEQFLVDARKFTRLISGLRDSSVKFRKDKGKPTLHITAGEGKYSMLTSTAEDYPNDRKDYEPMGVLPDGNIFRRMVGDTSYASDSGGQSPELGAVYYRVEDQELSIMATDRRRCAVATATLADAEDTPMAWFLVPNTTSAIISSTITTDAPLILGRSGKMFVLDNGQVWLSCRCLEGEWHYDAIQTHLMDMSDCDVVVVDRPELAQALDRAEIFGDSDAPIADLIFGGNEIEVRTDETALTGATSDLITTRSSCPPITKKVRTGAVRDALAHANGDVVEITLSEDKRAFMIERHDDGSDVAYSNQCFMVPQVVSKAGVNA